MPDNLAAIGAAIAEKSIAVAITLIVAAMYGFIKAAVEILITTNSRFDKLNAEMESRATETTNTMRNEVTRIHVHIASGEQFSLALALALMKVVPDPVFQDKASDAIAKMQSRNEPYG